MQDLMNLGQIKLPKSFKNGNISLNTSHTIFELRKISCLSVVASFEEFLWKNSQKIFEIHWIPMFRSLGVQGFSWGNLKNVALGCYQDFTSISKNISNTLHHIFMVLQWPKPKHSFTKKRPLKCWLWCSKISRFADFLNTKDFFTISILDNLES